MVCGDAVYDIRMFLQQPQVSFFMREEHKFFCAALRISKEQFGQQPAEFRPAGIGFVKRIEISVRNEDNLRIFHCFYEVPAGTLRYEASERNDKLIFRKKEKVFIIFRLRVMII